MINKQIQERFNSKKKEIEIFCFNNHQTFYNDRFYDKYGNPICPLDLKYKLVCVIQDWPVEQYLPDQGMSIRLQANLYGWTLE